MDDELFVPKSIFQRKTKIQSVDLKALGILPQPEGVPLYEVIYQLSEIWKTVRTEMRNSGGSDADAMKIEIGFKREKLMQLRIKNQTALSQLAPITVMKERIITTLVSYRQMVLLFIKEASINMHGDNRENEQDLTKMFNSLVTKIFEDIAEIKEFELDSNARLIMTRITNATEEKEDNEILEDLNSYNLDDISVDLGSVTSDTEQDE